MCSHCILVNVSYRFRYIAFQMHFVKCLRERLSIVATDILFDYSVGGFIFFFTLLMIDFWLPYTHQPIEYFCGINI